MWLGAGNARPFLSFRSRLREAHEVKVEAEPQAEHYLDRALHCSGGGSDGEGAKPDERACEAFLGENAHALSASLPLLLPEEVQDNLFIIGREILQPRCDTRRIRHYTTPGLESGL